MKAALLNEVFACSRIVRPTRRLESVSGYLKADGTVEQKQATFPDNALDVPKALKLFAFRIEDLEKLRALAGTSGEHPEFEFLGADPTTIGDIIEDVNVVRNGIAHGERIPDRYFDPALGRNGLNGRVSHISGLDDALAFTMRETLRRILAGNLVDNFTSRRAVSLFWKRGRGTVCRSY
jgi:hypothetical protein